MKKIKKNIYFENAYSGATVGALLFPEDTLLIDAPLRPEEGRAWLAELKQAGASPRRLLLNLDAHPDRTLGAQTLEAEVLAHEEIARQFRRRAAIFKALKQESGAEWEETPGLSGLRWIMPRVSFADSIALRFGGLDLQLEEHPGPGPGACWLVIPEEKIVFVGDAVTIGQPPFIGQADIENWLKSLDVLLSREYKDYTIICGRGGKATSREVKQMHAFLRDMHNKLRGISRHKNAPAEIEKLAGRYADRYKASNKLRTLYFQRLKHGMQEYAARQFPSRRN
jgi:glyoxylase-like metal-dependent hydrolase (beta-lactamase superfamily II)